MNEWQMMRETCLAQINRYKHIINLLKTASLALPDQDGAALEAAQIIAKEITRLQFKLEEINHYEKKGTT